jgi:hypothetical protein
VFYVDEDAGAEPDFVEGVVVFAQCLGEAVSMLLSGCWHAGDC